MKVESYLKNRCHVNTNEEGDRFVGIRADSDNVMVYFPIGYELPNDDKDIRKEIKILLKVLSVFTNKYDRLLHLNKYEYNNSVEFPIQAYLNVMEYYLSHNGNYYIEKDILYELGNYGKKNWPRTIKNQKPIFQNKSPIYLDIIVKKNSPNTNKLITKINRYCVYEAFKKIGWIYTNLNPEIPDISFDKNMFLSILYTKLSNTNNDNDKKLFNSMISIIKFIDVETKYRKAYFGTDNFEIVWEKLIDRVFGEPNKEKYFPHAVWNERYGTNSNKLARALEPDSIMIYNGKFYVLDAKYYKYGIYPEFGINSLPQSSDINKQITYAEFVKNKRAPKNAEVFNAFIMPYNKYNNVFGSIVEYLNVAEARGDWIESPKAYEKIQGIVVDTSYLLKNYDGNHIKDKELLSKEIEKYINID